METTQTNAVNKLAQAIRARIIMNWYAATTKNRIDFAAMSKTIENNIENALDSIGSTYFNPETPVRCGIIPLLVKLIQTRGLTYSEADLAMSHLVNLALNGFKRHCAEAGVIAAVVSNVSMSSNPYIDTLSGARFLYLMLDEAEEYREMMIDAGLDNDYIECLISENREADEDDEYEQDEQEAYATN